MKERPFVIYDFKEDVVVEPIHFHNVKILWRPSTEVDRDGITILQYPHDFKGNTQEYAVS